MTVEQGGTLESNLRISSQSKETNGRGSIFGIFKNLREKVLSSRLHDIVGPTNETPKVSPALDSGKEVVLDHRYIITDILPHTPRDSNPITYDDIAVVMEWAQHPDVKGHIYQLESGPEDHYRNRWGAYLEYYRGIKDDEGFEVEDRRLVTFLKAVHNDKMIGVTGIRWRAPRFYNKGRTAYWERLIVDPNLPPRRKIGLALGIEVGLQMYYKYDGYTGRLPATEALATTYADDEGAGYERNERLMSALGYRHYGGDTTTADNRRIRTWRQTKELFDEAVPGALERIRGDQPAYADYLEKEWKRLNAELDQKYE